MKWILALMSNSCESLSLIVFFPRVMTLIMLFGDYLGFGIMFCMFATYVLLYETVFLLRYWYNFYIVSYVLESTGTVPYVVHKIDKSHHILFFLQINGKNDEFFMQWTHSRPTIYATFLCACCNLQKYIRFRFKHFTKVSDCIFFFFSCLYSPAFRGICSTSDCHNSWRAGLFSGDRPIGQYCLCSCPSEKKKHRPSHCIGTAFSKGRILILPYQS